MKGSRLRKLLLCILILIEAVSFVAAFADNRPHGMSASAAFSRWLHDPPSANEQAFQKEMDKLDEGPCKIRRYGLLIFCANSTVLSSLSQIPR